MSAAPLLETARLGLRSRTPGDADVPFPRFADTDPDRAFSNGLPETLGAVLEGRLRAEWDRYLGVRDAFLQGLLAEDRCAR